MTQSATQEIENATALLATVPAAEREALVRQVLERRQARLDAEAARATAAAERGAALDAAAAAERLAEEARLERLAAAEDTRRFEDAKTRLLAEIATDFASALRVMGELGRLRTERNRMTTHSLNELLRSSLGPYLRTTCAPVMHQLASNWSVGQYVFFLLEAPFGASDATIAKAIARVQELDAGATGPVDTASTPHVESREVSASDDAASEEGEWRRMFNP